MSALEEKTRYAWQAWGAYAKWTSCAACGLWLYCRSKGGARFLCLDCFDQR
jgi:hypothetical protein